MNFKNILLGFLFLAAGYWVSEDNQRTEYGSHDDHFESYQQGVVQHTIQGPLAYRILMPYFIETIHYLFPEAPLKRIAFYLNIFLIFLVEIFFYRYMKLFLSEAASIAGTMWLVLGIMMGFASFMGVHAYESTDVANLMFMILALHLRYIKKWIWLAVILFISMLNRETPLLLIIPIFILWRVEKLPIRHLLLPVAALVIPYVLLKILIHPPEPSWFLTLYMSENIPFYEAGKLGIVFRSWIKFLLFCGPAMMLAFRQYKSVSVFLRSLLFIVPFFVTIHIFVGHVEEFRMWLPLFIFLIPPAMETFDKKEFL